MSAADLGSVREIAVRLTEAPNWPIAAYVAAIDTENTPRRMRWWRLIRETARLPGFWSQALCLRKQSWRRLQCGGGPAGGVGSRLMNALLEELRTEQVRELILEVRASNRAALGSIAR